MSTAKQLFDRRKRRVRYKLRKVEGRKRLSVFRSNQHIYAQVIDDASGTTVAQASSCEKDIAGKIKCGKSIAAAELVGKLIAERAKKAKVEGGLVFDRGGYLYHGRVKALADAAREGGLEF